MGRQKQAPQGCKNAPLRTREFLFEMNTNNRIGGFSTPPFTNEVPTAPPVASIHSRLEYHRYPSALTPDLHAELQPL